MMEKLLEQEAMMEEDQKVSSLLTPFSSSLSTLSRPEVCRGKLAPLPLVYLQTPNERIS